MSKQLILFFTLFLPVTIAQNNFWSITWLGELGWVLSTAFFSMYGRFGTTISILNDLFNTLNNSVNGTLTSLPPTYWPGSWGIERLRDLLPRSRCEDDKELRFESKYSSNQTWPHGHFFKLTFFNWAAYRDQPMK